MQAPAKKSKTPSKPHVLIVDDSRVMRVALRKLLAPEFELSECENGARAWELLSEVNDVQVVFTDLSMPEMDGTELISRIRGSQDPLLKNLPIIVITGKGDNEATKQEVVALGANDFVNKPFNALHVKARAQSYISHQRVAERLNHTEERLASETTVDPATGLGSIKYFERVATELLAQIKRNTGNWTWLGIEIDNYKSIYITHGKPASCVIARKIGDLINTTVREGDHAATLGPGRFMLILRSTNTNAAQVLAERLRSAIKNAVFSAHDQRLLLTASIGVCQPSVIRSSRYKDVLDQALHTLQQAKNAGGNTVCLHQPEKEAQAEPLSILAAIQLADAGETTQLIRHRSGIIKQLLPLLQAVAGDARKELKTFIDAVQEKL